MPETLRHVRLRTALFQLMDEHFAHLGTSGSDQFVYWDPTNPKVCLAPDAYFCLGPRYIELDTWKTWERGVPDLAFEIISDSDSAKQHRKKSLARFCELGVREVVFFDRRRPSWTLQAWDVVDGVPTERTIGADGVTPCKTLGCYLVVAPIEPMGLALRLARDPQGRDLYPTALERLATEREARLSAQHARDAVVSERDAVVSERDALLAEVARLRARLDEK